MFIQPITRSYDCFGSGYFGASRGDRKHKGVDLVCSPNEKVYSSINGVVTKHGYPYGDDLSFRYIEIEDEHGFYHRVFYVTPLIEVGDSVIVGEPIGVTQELGGKYPNITEHFHYEIIKYEDNGKVYFDPNIFLRK